MMQGAKRILPEELAKKTGKDDCLPQAQHHNDARPVVCGVQGSVQGMQEEKPELDQLQARDGLLDRLWNLHSGC